MCVATTSPTRLPAAAPASTAARTAPTSPRTMAVNQAGVDLFIADQTTFRGFYHCIRGLDHGDETSAFNMPSASSISALSRSSGGENN